jgi:hypothetical protein
MIGSRESGKTAGAFRYDCELSCLAFGATKDEFREGSGPAARHAFGVLRTPRNDAIGRVGLGKG